MAAPTQEYPPWLSPSAVVVTNAAGEVVTSTTVVYLPLTYLGPSIPLNSLYTYGGSTYPPTIVTGFITTTPTPTTSPPASTTTSATPTTTLPTTSDTTSTVPPTTSSTSVSSIPTSSTTSSSSISVTPTTDSSLTISPVPTESSSTSPSPTSTSNGPSATEPSSVGSLSRGQLVGVIVASILGLIFLFVFILAFWLWCKGRRNRRRSGEFSTITPLDEDYFIVGEDGRTPGEGSPRHSGEEGDSLLRRSQNVGAPGSPSRTPPAMAQVPAEMGARRPSVTRVPVPNTGSMSSSGSSSNASGYGVLLERPTLGILPPTAEEDHPFTGGGYALSDDEMREINRESVLPQEEQEYDYTGAYAISKDPELAPPRLIDPDNAFSQPEIPHPQLPPPAQQNRFSAQSAPSLADAEDAALLTARRVHVSDIPASGFNEDGSPAATRSGFLGAIGLTGLAGIGRLSWFNSGESLGRSGRDSPHFTPEPQRRSRRYSPTFSPVPMTDDDVEAGRAAMVQRTIAGPDVDSFGRVTRPTMAGLDLSGQRPISGVSMRSGTSGSGQTVYHDARSSMPGTPAVPRVATPLDIGVELALPEHAWLAGAIAGPAPPAYQDDDPFIDHSGAAPRMDLPQPVPPPADVDILDMPAPTALSHFQSSSSHFQSNTTNSDRDSATVSSIGLSRNPFPPGLDFMAHAKEVSGGMTWTPDGSLSAASGSASSPLWQMHHVVAAHEEIDNDTPTIDILEEEPPEARDTWRSIHTGAGGVSELGRRTTFGLPLYHHPAQIPSEQGSLHSMRSHVDPPSVRSTGSAPASVSLRSSPYGLGRPGSLHSSGHSGSLSSTSSSHRSEASASSSIARELVRSGSIISDGRGRRYDSRAGGSPSTSGMPPLSPFGQSRFATPPRSTRSGRSGLSQVANAPSHYSGEAIFKDGDIPTVDGPASDDVHFSPGASTIRTVNSGTTVQGPRTRTVSAVTFGSAGAATVGLGLSNAVTPIESAEEGDLGLLNDMNAGRRLGPAWMS